MAVVAEEQLKEFEEILQYLREHPVYFIENELGVRCWSAMRMIAESVAQNRRTTVRACHGVSKTISGACIAIWFLTVYSPAVVITTAPTSRQVRDLLWKEIGAIYARCVGRLPGKVALIQQVNVESDWYMHGFSTENAVNLEGYHSPNILWVLDEAKGLPKWLYDAVEGSLTGGNAKVLELSTTDGATPLAPFRRHHTLARTGWNCIHLSAFDSPFIDATEWPEYKRNLNTDLYAYGKPKKGREWPESMVNDIAIADDAWIKDRLDWKKADPSMWESKVLGEFPEQTVDSIIPVSWIEAAVKERRVHGNGDPAEYGLDVARMGDDRNVLFRKSGGSFEMIETWGMTDTMGTVGKVMNFVGRGEVVKVDMIGVGAGVFDALAEQGQACVGVNSAESAIYEPKKYANLRAEMWFRAREVFREQYEKGGVLSIPDDPELIEELSGVRYKTKSDGRLIVEPKEDYKKRLGRSPDKGDAFVYALFHFPEGHQDSVEWAT